MRRAQLCAAFLDRDVLVPNVLMSHAIALRSQRRDIIYVVHQSDISTMVEYFIVACACACVYVYITLPAHSRSNNLMLCDLIYVCIECKIFCARVRVCVRECECDRERRSGGDVPL